MNIKLSYIDEIVDEPTDFLDLLNSIVYQVYFPEC